METRPGDVVGGFELERKLGVGGMGTVWLAHPLSPGVPYARVVLKQMHAHLAEQPAIRDLFMEEARLARGLKHPNVVRVVDCGFADGDCFIAMEYIDGVDLRSAMVAHGGPLWPALAATLVADACRGLHHAHRAGVVHRDVAPDNIMVDRTGQVRLVDFGVARAETTELTTRTGLRKGKVRYMAPEYLLDHVVNPATDVYSMGLTLHELLTGEVPFSDVVGVVAVHGAIATRGVRRADAVRPSLPSHLVDVVERATARDPKRRTQTAGALERELRAFNRDYRPPSSEEIGEEVQLWKQRLAAGPLRTPRRQAGSYGQLESTEFVRLKDLDALPPLRAGLGDPSVLVAHALDPTEAEWKAPSLFEAPTDPLAAVPERPTDPGAPAHLPSVVLDPELEAVAERHHGPRRRRRPARRKRR